MTEKAKVKGREKRRKGKVISSFVVLAIVLSVSLASVATVSAQVEEPEVTGIGVTANPISIPLYPGLPSTITATVTWVNQDDGDGFKIHFEIIGDAYGAEIGPEYVNTDVNGVATAYLSAGLTEGTVTVRACWDVGEPDICDDTTVELGEAGENGTVDGTITYACNETGIAGATVKLTQGGAEKYSTTTNTNGDYEFTDVTPGGYDVNASKTRFWDNSTAVTVSAGGTETADMMLWLKGDLNNDGISADKEDTTLMFKAYLGYLTPDYRHDLNENGVYADKEDAVLMLKAYLGYIILE